MHALIVVSHPEPNSLTHAVAACIGKGLASAGHTFEMADLSTEGFRPEFTAADIAVHLQTGALTADVAAEQKRIERADALVLVYPVYWWAMPGMIKGWIDRVFVRGWAYDVGADSKPVKRLMHLPVHLVALAAGGEQTYAKHGFSDAMKTQIEHGIFGYCGAPVMTSRLLTDTHEPNTHTETAFDIGRGVFDISAMALAVDTLS